MLFFLYFLINKKERVLAFDIGEKYSTKKMDSTIVNEIVEALNILMQEQKLYQNSNLKSSEVAEKLNISPHQFSQLLNDNLGKSFSTYINEYRVEKAKQIIKSNTKYTLDAIGNESGFNSKSSFYSYFKNIVGMTPAMYRKQFLSSKL